MDASSRATRDTAPVKRRPGQPAGLSREHLAREALALVDEQGTSALTVRGLARRLDVEPMSLYNYFPNKEALLDAVWEEVISAGGLGEELGRASWQEFARAFAHRFRAALLAHPNALPIMLGRYARTPRSLEVVELALAELVRLGLDLGVSIDLVNTIATFTMAHALNEHELASAAPPDIDPEALPTLAAAVAQGFGDDPADDARRYDAAIDSLIDGYGLQAARAAERDSRSTASPS